MGETVSSAAAQSDAPASAQTSTSASILEVWELTDDWRAAATAPDLCAGPLDGLEALEWHESRVPGTAAAALSRSGRWRHDEPHDFDAEDWWFRTRFQAGPAGTGEEALLLLDGIATVAEVYLNGERILDSESMFARHELNVGDRLREDGNELAICCRALGPRLQPRRRPRARWRTRLVREKNLRFFRTMLLGRAPGFAPGPAAVGPWRNVSLVRRRGLAIDELSLLPSVSGADGRLTVAGRMRELGAARLSGVEIELSGPTGVSRAPLTLTRRSGTVEVGGELTVPDVAPWWPHTHGEPTLYEARLMLAWVTPNATDTSGADADEGGGVGGNRDCGGSSNNNSGGGGESNSATWHARPVGFRALAFGAGSAHEVERDGLDLHVNGVRVFARGAVWTPVDPIGLAPTAAALRAALEQARDAGMNMLRIPGTSAYESEAFHDLCDELGLLVWQDFMFANMDYPIADDGFRETVEREAKQVLGDLAGRPSLAVLCGNSEIEQQVAMLGLDPGLGRGELFGELLPKLIDERGVDAAYVPSAPCGGGLPFRPDCGVANYYGVGGYRRPLSDARRAEVRFAAECLAFANVPAETAIEELLPGTAGELVVHHPAWKAGVPRDAGSGWDFEDVRDHYLALLHDVDPGELRRVDHERYLELSRAVTGEVMAEVFGEWRRERSPCGGGLVLWLRDLAPGAGWGLVDHRGEPKVAYEHVRRALAPVAVWTTDEGLGGVAVHAANDRSSALAARLRVTLYRDFEQRVGEAERTVELAPHSVSHWNVEELLGHFVDASWVYRFGPPQQDLIVVGLWDIDAYDGRDPVALSQAVRFPAGRPREAETAAGLGLRADASALADGTLCLRVHSRRLAYGVRIHAPGYVANDDAFSVEPGGTHVVKLTPRAVGQTFSGALTALNLHGRLAIDLAGP